MLVIQHIWHRWDKWTRSADPRHPRPLLDPVYAFPAVGAVANAQQQALVHTVSTDAWQGAATTTSHGAMTHDEWTRADSVLDWHVRGDDVAITLNNPSRWRLQTKWPAWLPSPLFVLKPGETARIEWNGRLRMSLFGANRSSYFEQHIYWLAVTDAPRERLFLDAQPRKNLDYTTHIY